MPCGPPVQGTRSSSKQTQMRAELHCSFQINYIKKETLGYSYEKIYQKLSSSKQKNSLPSRYRSVRCYVKLARKVKSIILFNLDTEHHRKNTDSRVYHWIRQMPSLPELDSEDQLLTRIPSGTTVQQLQFQGSVQGPTFGKRPFV